MSQPSVWLFAQPAGVPVFCSNAPGYGTATSLHNYGTTPGTTFTGFAAPFGSFGGPIFGTGTNTSAPTTGLIFAPPTTTSSFGGIGGLGFSRSASQPSSFSLFPNTSTSACSSMFALAHRSLGPTRTTRQLLTFEMRRKNRKQLDERRQKRWLNRIIREHEATEPPGAMLEDDERGSENDTDPTVPLPIQLNRGKSYIKKMNEQEMCEAELVNIFYQRQREGAIKLPDVTVIANCVSQIDPLIRVVGNCNDAHSGLTVTNQFESSHVNERGSTQELQVPVMHDPASVEDNETHWTRNNDEGRGSVTQEPDRHVHVMTVVTESTKPSGVVCPIDKPSPSRVKGKGVGKGRKGKKSPAAYTAMTLGAQQNLGTDQDAPRVVIDNGGTVPDAMSGPSTSSTGLNIVEGNNGPPPSNVAAGKIKPVIVVDKDSGYMDEYQAIILKKTLEKAQYVLFKSNRIKPLVERQLPIFMERPVLSQGGLKVVPGNDYTLRWLNFMIDKLPILWEGSTGFKVIPESEQPRYHTGVIYVPDFGEDKEDTAKWRYVLREYLSELNPDLNINKWPIFSHLVQQKGDCYNHVLAMGILPEDMEKLTRKQFRLHYTLKRIFVIVKGYTSVTTEDSAKDMADDVDRNEDVFVEEKIEPIFEISDDSKEDAADDTPQSVSLALSCADLYTDNPGPSTG